MNQGAVGPTVGNANGASAYAMKFIGTKYVWGAGRDQNSLLNGGTSYDCSSFVAHVVYKSYGISPSTFGTTVAMQWKYVNAGGGTAVPYGQAQAGDILFMFTTGPGVPGHIGISTGNGNMVHASGGQSCSRKGTCKGVTTRKMMSQARTKVYRLNANAQNVTTGNPSIVGNANQPASGAQAANRYLEGLQEDPRFKALGDRYQALASQIGALQSEMPKVPEATLSGIIDPFN